MKDIIKSTITAKDAEITVLTTLNNDDYISLTDIAKYKDSENPRYIIQNWMRNKTTVEFLGLWEELHNPDFNRVEFDAVKDEAGANAFVLTPKKWIETTNAIGIISKSGRYESGTFAHSDIAFEFASWVSPEFKLYIIQDYQRLKSEEAHRYSLDWNVKRLVSKANYKIHTDAIKEQLIPQLLSKPQQGFIYAEEADVLNKALFGLTAKEWRNKNPHKKGNIRDYATIEQLLVLSNLESLNAVFIEQGKPQSERLEMLNKLAVQQMIKLTDNSSVKKLEEIGNKQINR